jgi:hypothetical protein
MNSYNLDMPSNLQVEDLTPDARQDYEAKVQITYRQREAEWLRRIEQLNIWPVLVICGSDHFDHFCELLTTSGIEVISDEKNWGGLKG